MTVRVLPDTATDTPSRDAAGARYSGNTPLHPSDDDPARPVEVEGAAAAATGASLTTGAPGGTSPADGAAGCAEGRIWLGGDVVAAGYLEDPAQTASHFRVLDGRRWYRTDDLGRLAADGTLTVLGRTDDVINTGGVKVSAGRVASVLLDDARVRQALVVAVPHPEWGQTVAAVFSVRSTPESDPAASGDPNRKTMDRESLGRADVVREALERELAAAVRDRLGAPAVPKLWRHVSALPQLATGKPDRRAAAALFAAPPGTPPDATSTPPA